MLGASYITIFKLIQYKILKKTALKEHKKWNQIEVQTLMTAEGFQCGIKKSYLRTIYLL